MSAVSNDFVKSSIYSEFLAPNQPINYKTMVYRFHIWKFMELACTRFKWTGLPDSIDKRFLELTLNLRGLSVFFNSKSYGYLALRASPVGVNNLLDQPTKFVAYGSRGNQFATLSFKDCVPIWGSILRTPDYDIMNYYSSMIAEIMTSIKVSVINSRNPAILVGDENFRTSLENIYRQVEEGQPMIGVYEGLGEQLKDRVTALDMKIDANIFDRLHILRNDMMHDCLTFMGIDNANEDKKERLVDNEVNSNNSQIEHYRQIALMPRLEATERINNMFGLNVGVEWNESNILETVNPEFTGETLNDIDSLERV